VSVYFGCGLLLQRMLALREVVCFRDGRSSLAAVVLVFSCTAIMASTHAMGIADKQTINFTAPTVVGGTVLPARRYNVTHQRNGQTDAMIFKNIGGKSEAQTKCSLVPFKEKASNAEQRYSTNAQNQRILHEITFEEDKAIHVLAQ
jgi:hypothetical protein